MISPNFEGVRGDLVAIGRDIRAAVLQEVGIPTSVVLGPTKTRAKLANHVCKTADRKPGAYPARLAQLCDLGSLTPADFDAVLGATPVGNVWGIGKRIGARLQEAGVRTVLDFVRSDAATIRRQYSVVVEKTLLELRGTACIGMSGVDDPPASRQQILVSRSFGTPIDELAGIVEAVSEFTSRAAEKLRHQASAAAHVGIFFTTSPYRKHDPQHGVNVSTPLVRPSSDTHTLVAAAVDLARRHFRPGFNYTKAGVVFTELQAASVHQGELDLLGDAEPAEAAPAPKDRSALMDAMDVLNRRFGRDSVRVGSTTLASHGSDVRRWATKQERRSPRYTTRWDEMPVVRA